MSLLIGKLDETQNCWLWASIFGQKSLPRIITYNQVKLNDLFAPFWLLSIISWIRLFISHVLQCAQGKKTSLFSFLLPSQPPSLHCIWLITLMRKEISSLFPTPKQSVLLKNRRTPWPGISSPSSAMVRGWETFHCLFSLTLLFALPGRYQIFSVFA